MVNSGTLTTVERERQPRPATWTCRYSTPQEVERGFSLRRHMARLGHHLSLLAVGIALLPPPANATYFASALVKFTTDYVYRGIEKSGDHPAVQANASVIDERGFFGGGWLSQVDIGAARLEANPYVGFRYRLAEDWRVEASAAGYFYDGKIFGHHAHYAEIDGLLHFRDLFTGRFGVAVDAYGLGDEVFNSEIATRYPLTDASEVSAALGYENGHGGSGYDDVYWSLGLTHFWGRNVALDLHYRAARSFNERRPEPTEFGVERVQITDRVVFSISISY